MDYAIGVLLDELKKRGVLDNTIIYFAGDNGFGGGPDSATKIRSQSNHYETISSKGGMGEGAIRVPGILHWPARWKTPRRIATPIAGYDLMPTFLAAAGVENVAHRPFDGENVLPVLDGTTPQRGDLCFWTWGGDVTGTRAKEPLVLGASYLIRGDYRLHCAADGRQILQQIGQETDELKKIALMEQFVEKFPKHEGAPWVFEQMIPVCQKAGQFDKALGACEQLLTLDPKYTSAPAPTAASNRSWIIAWSNSPWSRNCP